MQDPTFAREVALRRPSYATMPSNLRESYKKNKRTLLSLTEMQGNLKRNASAGHYKDQRNPEPCPEW
jgi:hypothetical protein